MLFIPRGSKPLNFPTSQGLQRGQRILFSLILSVWVSLGVTPGVQGVLVCKQQGHQEICLFHIKRSAKNYWEYRAEVSVNGVKRPLEVYNCRDRVRTRRDGKVVPFAPQEAGELICKMVHAD